jgi:predicted phosphodiesterase
MNKQFESAINLAKQGYGRTKIAEELGIPEHDARAAVTYVRFSNDGELGLDEVFDVDTTFADFEDGFDEAVAPIQIDGDNILVLSDIHFPRHHRDALLYSLRYGINHKVNAVYLNGDIMDCERISRFQNGKHVPTMSEEVKITKEFLVKVRGLFPQASIYYKEGNHEKRFVDYMVNNAPEMADITLSLSEKLDLANLGIIHVEENQIATVSHLHIVHGHEYKSMFGGGIYHARSTRLKAGTNVVLGHFHRTQTDIDRKLNDEYVGAWATGCLCKLDPKYAGKSKWNHGFARVEVYQDTFKVHNEIIL